MLTVFGLREDDHEIQHFYSRKCIQYTCSSWTDSSVVGSQTYSRLCCFYKVGLEKVVKSLTALALLTVLGVAHVAAPWIHRHVITAHPGGWVPRVTTPVSMGNSYQGTVATVYATQALWVWAVTASVPSTEKL